MRPSFWRRIPGNWSYLLRIFARRPEDDVDAELRFHFDERVEELVASGLSPSAARAQTVAELGDLDRVRAQLYEIDRRIARRQTRADWWEGIAQDLRHTMRGLMRSPGFTIIAVATLAVGIGANTAIFSVVDNVLLRPLPYADSDQLVWLNFTAPGLGYDEMPFSEGVYAYMRTAQRSLQGMALFSGQEFDLSGRGDASRVSGERVTPGFFQLLGVRPALGRAFAPGDGKPGAARVVILSHALWLSEFGGDPGAIGRTLTIDGVAHEVVGIAPPRFAFPGPSDRVWLPLIIDPANLNAGNFSYRCIGRLKPGETVAAARADFQSLVSNLGAVEPDLTPAVVTKMHFAVVVRSLKERVVGGIRRPLWLVLGTGAFVLLIALANVANLFLVRAEGRRHELALRTALGASRADLIGAMLGESLVLALVGGGLGLGLALVGVDALVALLPSAMPRAADIGLNGDVLLFTLAVAGMAGLVFGSFPMVGRAVPELSAALKGNARMMTAGRAQGRLRHVLVSGQVALALVLLIGAGLMVRTFQAARSVDMGFSPDHVLTFDVALPRADYPTAYRAANFWRDMVDRIGALPGVRSAAVANNLPLGSSFENGSIMIEDQPVPAGRLMPLAERQYVSPAYFQTMSIPVLQGRALDAHDAADGVRAVVVNQSFARHWWPAGNAPGHWIRESASDPWYQVVGVVGNVRFQSLVTAGGDATYFPLVAGSAASPRTPMHMAVAVQASGDPTALITAVRAQVRALDPHLPIAHVQTLRSLVNDSMSRTSFILLMLGIAAAVALLLSVVGIYGVISYVVGQRRREIGVRMALGATARDVRRMVVRQGVMLGAAGVIVGLIAALGLSRLLRTLLFGVSASDPVTYGLVAAALLGVTVLASYLPARRASAMDPTEALRGG